MSTQNDTLFAALADPTRRAIFERLAENGEQSVVIITKQSGVAQPTVSRHLAVLKRAGLVADRRDGRQTHYRADLQGLRPMVDWVGHYAAFWARHFDKLDDLLRRMDQ